MSASTPVPPIDLTAAPAPARLPGWKNEVSARLHAHRTRRPRTPDDQPALPGMEPAATASAVAARVAERYARIPSWREALAAEAAAKAAAEAAAQAEAEARRKLAEHLEAVAAAERAAAAAIERESAPPPRPVRSATELRAADSLFFADPEPEPEPFDEAHSVQQVPIRYSVSSDSLPMPRSTPAQARAMGGPSFRMGGSGLHDPLEEATVEPTQSLPARIIQFPRELVAPRKARPRIAEGPLLEPSSGPDESPQSPALELPEFSSQLRIFEADPDLPETSTRTAPSASLPEWHSIHLDSSASDRDSAVTGMGRRHSRTDELPLHVACFADRFMAGVVDVALTLAAFLLFVLVFAACTAHPPAGKVAAGAAAATLLVMWILYQLVFFSLSSATPGMMYAKIALCTFSDENPTRNAMRGRIAALLLSALPLGLGFLWSAFDEDGLGWHDRITMTYQRSYRNL